MDNNDQLLIERGNAAQEILENPAFSSVINELLNLYAQTCMNSAPHQKEARESSYFQSRAVNDVVSVLRQWAIIKDQLLMDSEEEDYE